MCARITYSFRQIRASPAVDCGKRGLGQVPDQRVARARISAGCAVRRVECLVGAVCLDERLEGLVSISERGRAPLGFPAVAVLPVEPGIQPDLDAVGEGAPADSNLIPARLSKSTTAIGFLLSAYSAALAAPGRLACTGRSLWPGLRSWQAVPPGGCTGRGVRESARGAIA
jgi:hypothetical protein